MIILGVDTSTDLLSISLIDEKRILSNYNSICASRHSDMLIPGIQKTLRKAGIGIKDVGLFSIGIGPGSFTGMRVGITVVRALAIALKKPILGIPTMDAIAYNGLMHLKKARLIDNYQKICPLLDAKRNQMYSCVYRHDGDNVVKETDYLLEPADRLIKRLKSSILFLGNAVPLYRERLSHKRGLKARFLDDKIWFPKASVVAKMALKEYQRGRTDNPYDLVPLYLYARDCNVKR